MVLMIKRQKNASLVRPVGLVVLVLASLGLIIAILLRGTNVALFNPQGLIAGQQLKLMVYAVSLMLTVAIPTLFVLYYFAWKYRESNSKARYEPNAHHGKLFMVSLWAIPSVMVLLLALVMWPATHVLEPNKPIASPIKPITIQVIALRWKWLFIYPDQNIATVNFVQIPMDTPIKFELTADETPMSSFWIPNLAGQLYAMTGHTNQLNLMAKTPGDYPGRSAEINGAGFAGMKFIARASSQPDFDRWVQNIRWSSDPFNTNVYESLVEPSQNNPAAFYAVAETGLYDKVLMKYSGSHDHHMEQQ